GLTADRFPLDRYPHELSGGQRQRVVIAMAIALRPRLLIADEPTTALDVTTQAEVLRLLDALVRENNMALLFISHDLPVVAGIVDDVVVLRRGQAVEAGPVDEVFARPAADYTRALIAAARAFDAGLGSAP
ncbi:MAG: ATP-binding cassette domain-containing protein, partial [Devosia sp.]